ncbi:MAG: acylphosphatase [Lautropia sp.]
MPDTALRIVVSGRVQGVGFREFVRRRADALGVGGWVRNRADGRVEAVLAGDAEVLEQLVAAVACGPRAARVDAIERSAADATAAPRPFRVERGA